MPPSGPPDYVEAVLHLQPQSSALRVRIAPKATARALPRLTLVGPGRTADREANGPSSQEPTGNGLQEICIVQKKRTVTERSWIVDRGSGYGSCPWVHLKI